jgi:hypothetical protein
MVLRKKSPYNPTHSTHPTPGDDSQGLAGYDLASGASGSSGISGVFYPPWTPYFAAAYSQVRVWISRGAPYSGEGETWRQHPL